MHIKSSFSRPHGSRLISRLGICMLTVLSVLSAGLPYTAVSQGELVESTPATGEKLQYSGFQTVLENERFALDMAGESGEFLVRDKLSGQEYRSNPADAATDALATEDTRNYLQSQVCITYLDQQNKEYEMLSFVECVQKNQVSIERLDDGGIRVIYDFGRVEQRMVVPAVVSKSFYEEIILGSVSEGDAKRLNVYYKKYDINELPSTADKSAIKRKYPTIEQEYLYVLTSVSNREQKIIEGILKEAGVTLEMIDEDYAKLSYEAEEAFFAYFQVPVVYYLEKDGLTAAIDPASLQYDREHFQLIQLKLLPFFGAGNGDGYLFVPDGSGAVMGFNTDASNTTLKITKSVYGDDYTIAGTQNVENTYTYALPVFGIKREQNGIFAIIEDGDAVATISTELSNIIHSYNTAYVTFMTTPYAVESFGTQSAGSKWYAFDKELFTGQYKVKYILLDEADNSYSGMARVYRDYLIDQQVLTDRVEGAGPPLYVEMLGAASSRDTFLGFSYQKQFALTTFREAQQIVGELKEQGADNLNLLYRGWMNGGLESTLPSGMKVESVLGGKKGLQELSDFAQENGIGFYPLANFQTVRKDSWFDGFSSRKDSARNLHDKLVQKTGLHLSTNLFTVFEGYRVGPAKSLSASQKFFKAYDPLDIGGIGLLDFGVGVGSDYRKSAYHNRQQAIDALKSIAEARVKQGDSVLLDGANAYALSAADHIVSLPQDANTYRNIDYAVPFIQMVLHGYVNYSGAPLNMAGDAGDAMLKAIENGSGLYYVLAAQNQQILKESAYPEYYSVSAEDWLPRIASEHEELSAVFNGLEGQLMVSHERIDEDVYRTAYENGTSIYVNYRAQNYTAGSLTIAAKHYTVVAAE